jgi:hypothetical protein
MQLEKKIPRSGTASLVGGDISDSIDKKKQMDRRTVICSVIFSPASGGSTNPSKVIDVIRRHGIIKLNP